MTINAGSRPAVAPLDRAELGRLRAFGGTHLVAVADDRAVVGYLLAFAQSCAYDGEEFRYFVAQLRQPFLYVDQVAVDPQRKRSGIGGKLYAALLEHARAQQAQLLCCEVNTTPANPASLDFHWRLGFAPIGNGDTLDGRRVTFLVRSV